MQLKDNLMKSNYVLITVDGAHVQGGNASRRACWLNAFLDVDTGADCSSAHRLKGTYKESVSKSIPSTDTATLY